MKRLAILVTPDGHWVLEDSTEFFSAFGDPSPDYNAASFAVEDILAVFKFQVLYQWVMDIELHPS